MAQGQNPAVAVPAPAERISLLQTESWQAFMAGLWSDNPIFRQILGICSALAVTNKMDKTLTMGIALTLVAGFSSLFVSLLRNVIPKQVRMISQILIVAVFVILVDMILKAHFYSIGKAIGPFVGLIITNCIIMGRCETFASKNKPTISFIDGIGCGLGYAFILLLVSVVRELLGSGTLMNMNVLGADWPQWIIMVAPPGAFFVLGISIWVMRGLSKDVA